MLEKLFPELIENYPAKLGVFLNLLSPECGGIILAGKKGVGKSLFLKLIKKFFEINNIPFVEIPLNVSAENLIGGINIEETLKKGRKVFEKGLLKKAKDKYVLIDNLNLFSEEIISLIFQEINNYTLICTFNPEEGLLSPHIADKIGMCVFMENVKEKENLKNLLKNSEYGSTLKEIYLKEYEETGKWLKELKEKIKNVNIKEDIKDYIVEKCLSNGVSSHRGEIFLYHASRSFCALKGEFFIKREHVDFVSPLVLFHRSRQLEEKPEKKNKPREDKDKKPEKELQNQQKQDQEKKQEKKKPESKRKDFPEVEKKEDKEDFSEKEVKLFVPGKASEKIFDIGELFKLKKFVFKKDKVIRNSSGKRTKSRTLLKGARFVRSVEYSKDMDVDIFGTIKNAAPYQKLRGRKGKLIIYKEDLKFKEKEKKVGHLVIFVVDGSGSMAAQQRMFATKGAIFSLLMDCYQKREKVSMILFRKFSAEVVLPPTSSVTLAYRKLKELPTGGNTPLGAGLLSAYQLIKKYHLKFPQDRILLLLLTDGKANIPIKPREDPFKEIKNLCQEFKELSYVDFVVIDTEVKSDYLKMDLAKEIATWGSAYYFLLEEIKSESLVNIVRTFYESSFFS